MATETVTVRMMRTDPNTPWGFRLQGGKEFSTPLQIGRVAINSLAERAGLREGDYVVQIGGRHAEGYSHKDAQQTIASHGNNLDMVVQRTGTTIWKPSITPLDLPPISDLAMKSVHANRLSDAPFSSTVPPVKYSLEHDQRQDGYNVPGFNSAARPYAYSSGGPGSGQSPAGYGSNQPGATGGGAGGASPYGGVGGGAPNKTLTATITRSGFPIASTEIRSDEVPSLMQKQQQYIAPVAMHSPRQTTAEQYLQHTGGLFGTDPSLQKKEDPKFLQSETLRLIQESDKSRKTHSNAPLQESENPTQSDSFRRLTKAVDHTSYHTDSQSSVTGAGGTPICDSCGRQIIGVFCKAAGKTMHADCFNCSTCGNSLKNTGYFVVNEKLYCETHARQHQNMFKPAAPIDPNAIYSRAAPADVVLRQQTSPKGSYQPNVLQPGPISGQSAGRTSNYSNVSSTTTTTNYSVPSGPGGFRCSDCEIDYEPELVHGGVPNGYARESVAPELMNTHTIHMLTRSDSDNPTVMRMSTAEDQDASDGTPSFAQSEGAFRVQQENSSIKRTDHHSTIDRNEPVESSSTLETEWHRDFSKRYPHDDNDLAAADGRIPFGSFRDLDDTEPILRVHRPLIITNPRSITHGVTRRHFVWPPQKPKTDAAWKGQTHRFDEYETDYGTTRKYEQVIKYKKSEVLAEIGQNRSAVKPHNKYLRSQHHSFDNSTYDQIEEEERRTFYGGEPLKSPPPPKHFAESFAHPNTVLDEQQFQKSSRCSANSYPSLNSANQALVSEPPLGFERFGENVQGQPEGSFLNANGSHLIKSSSMTLMPAQLIYGNRDVSSSEIESRDQQYTNQAKVRSTAQSSRDAESDQQSLLSPAEIVGGIQSGMQSNSSNAMSAQASSCTNDAFSITGDFTIITGQRSLTDVTTRIIDGNEYAVPTPPLGNNYAFAGYDSEAASNDNSQQQHQEFDKTAMLSPPPVRPRQVYSGNAGPLIYESARTRTSQSPVPLMRSSSDRLPVAPSAAQPIENVMGPKVQKPKPAIQSYKPLYLPSSTLPKSHHAKGNNATTSYNQEVGAAYSGDRDTLTECLKAESSLIAKLKCSGPKLGSGVSAGARAPRRGKGILKSLQEGPRIPVCTTCQREIRGPFILALGKPWCPDHFVCGNPQCGRKLQDVGFVEENNNNYCERCFEQYFAPQCAKCGRSVIGVQQLSTIPAKRRCGRSIRSAIFCEYFKDCLNALERQWHPECFICTHCHKPFGNSSFFMEEGRPYCEADWNQLFTTKCIGCQFPIEAGDRWVEALGNAYHSDCFTCQLCRRSLEGQSFYAKGGKPFCKDHA